MYFIEAKGYIQPYFFLLGIWFR